MGKKLWPLLLALAILCFPSGKAAAGNLSLGLWPASGSQMWRISFPPAGASELHYPHKSTYLTASYENGRPNQPRLRVEGGLASSVKAAAGSDSDWDYTQSSSLWYYGEFKTTGTSAFVNVDWVSPAGANREYFIGYSYRQNAFRMTDGVYYIDNYTPQTPPDILTGLDSTYKAVYQGPRVGVRGRSPLSPRVSMIGSVAYSPFAYAQGRGWWNLRALDFDQAGPAQMLDAYLGLRYDFGAAKDRAVTAGYRYQYMALFHGKENTSDAVSWDKATSVQKGFYFTGEFKF